jgi:hypothetical protein
MKCHSGRAGDGGSPGKAILPIRPGGRMGGRRHFHRRLRTDQAGTLPLHTCVRRPGGRRGRKAMSAPWFGAAQLRQAGKGGGPEAAGPSG